MSNSTAEQLVFTWANTTFSGQGMGVVATTPGWAGPVSAQDPALAPLLMRLQLAKDQWMVRTTFDHGLGPSVTAARGVGRDGYEREGRYVASVVVAPGAEAFLPVLAAVVGGVGALDWDIDRVPTRDLTPLMVGDVENGPDRAMLAWILANWSPDSVVELPMDTNLAVLAATVVAIPSPLVDHMVLSGTRPDAVMVPPDDRISHAADVLASGLRPAEPVATIEELVDWADAANGSLVPPWGDEARRILSEFWSAGEAPEPGVGTLAVEIGRAYPVEAAAWLGELRPPDARLWQALRLMDDPTTGAALIAASGLRSIFVALAVAPVGPVPAAAKALPPSPTSGADFHLPALWAYREHLDVPGGTTGVKARDTALPPVPEHERQGLRDRFRRGRSA